MKNKRKSAIGTLYIDETAPDFYFIRMPREDEPTWAGSRGSDYRVRPIEKRTGRALRITHRPKKNLKKIY